MRKLHPETQSFKILKMIAGNPEITKEEIRAAFPNFQPTALSNLLNKFHVYELGGKFEIPVKVQDMVRDRPVFSGSIATRRDVNVYRSPVMRCYPGNCRVTRL